MAIDLSARFKALGGDWEKAVEPYGGSKTAEETTRTAITNQLRLLMIWRNSKVAEADLDNEELNENDLGKPYNNYHLFYKTLSGRDKVSSWFFQEKDNKVRAKFRPMCGIYPLKIFDKEVGRIDATFKGIDLRENYVKLVNEMLEEGELTEIHKEIDEEKKQSAELSANTLKLTKDLRDEWTKEKKSLKRRLKTEQISQVDYEAEYKRKDSVYEEKVKAKKEANGIKAY